MAKTFQLEVITPDRVTLRDEVEMVIVPALDGELGVLAGHTPLVTGLKIGVTRVKTDGRWLKVSNSGGFMEVQPEKVSMVVSTAELPEEIDVDRALAAKERAEERLQKSTEKVDHARANAALERALARLKAADRY